jgi:hypothetical protein
MTTIGSTMRDAMDQDQATVAGERGSVPPHAEVPSGDAAAAAARRQAATAYVQVLRRGRRQAELVKAMLERLAAGSDDVDRGAAAAGWVARFAADEGWVTGDYWRRRGPRLLLSRWALEHDVDHEAIDTWQRSRREDATATTPEVEQQRTEDTPDRAPVDPRGPQRRARDHDVAIDVLFGHLRGPEPDVEQTLWAARRAVEFAIDEGWARGPLWLAYGPQLLLAEWALRNGVRNADVGAALAASAAAEDDGDTD